MKQAIIAVLGNEFDFLKLVRLITGTCFTGNSFMLPGGTIIMRINSTQQLQGFELLDILILESAKTDLIELAKTRIRQKVS